MIKKILVICLTFLLFSCSGMEITSEANTEEKLNKLVLKLEIIKNEIEREEFSTLTNSLDLSLIKRYKVKELIEKLPKNLKFYYTKPKVVGVTATNIVGLRYAENTVYLDITYKYNKDVWKIIDIKERGGIE